MEVSALTHASAAPGLRGPSALLRLQSDERLIALTRRGHNAAFEVLCSRYQSRLLSFTRHMLSSREDAEDVLQEVFAAAFNAVTVFALYTRRAGGLPFPLREGSPVAAIPLWRWPMDSGDDSHSCCC